MENKINRPDAEAMHRILTQNPDNTVGTILRLAWLEGLKRDEIINHHDDFIPFSWGHTVLYPLFLISAIRQFPLSPAYKTIHIIH